MRVRYLAGRWQVAIDGLWRAPTGRLEEYTIRLCQQAAASASARTRDQYESTIGVEVDACDWAGVA